MESDSIPPNGGPHASSSLALLSVPFIFTQDGVLDTGDFIRQSEERGYKLSLDTLQKLHSQRILLPLYRVSDAAVPGRIIKVEADYGMNPRGWTLQAAAVGRLRDPSEEGYSSFWPYVRPVDEDDIHWWNGFIYSSWQLLEVPDAIKELEWRNMGLHSPAWVQYRQRIRQRALALAALAPRYLPGILGSMRIPPGTDQEALWQFRATSSVRELLRISGLAPERLKDEAEVLLSRAHGDPLVAWLPLIRYASHEGWSKLRGESLHCMWGRVAAEVLLRAHEDLAADGVLEQLPDLSGANFWSALHDRITVRHKEATTLERALAELGLSPHPRVILLVEGETELDHVPRLLTEFGLNQPQRVRVQITKSSKINAHLIARYGVAPRVGRKIGDDTWLLDASPTALVIAMDPENDFETQDKRDTVRRKLQDSIREEVLYQDADITQGYLDALVNVFVWGEDKYELANFSNDELIPAITKLATAQGRLQVSSSTWEQDLQWELNAARSAQHDIKIPIQRVMRAELDKVELAKLLWPTLKAKCEAELAADTIKTPVLRLVLDVYELVAKLNGVRAFRGRSADMQGE